MVRSVMALLAGFFALCLPTALLLVISGTARAVPNTFFLLFAALYFAGFGMLGGFLTATVARRAEFAHASAVAGFITAMLVISLVVERNTGSIWSQMMFLFVAV